jgi:hypothetical protein
MIAGDVAALAFIAMLIAVGVCGAVAIAREWWRS